MKRIFTTQNLDYAFLFFLLFPFFLPTYFSVANVTIILKINKIWKALSLCCIAFLYLKNFKKIKLKKIVLAIGLYQIYMILISYFQSENYNDMISVSLNIGAIVIIANYLIQQKRNSFLATLLFIYEILIFTNFLSILMFPNGISIPGTDSGIPVYLLGIDNTHITVIYPAIVISLLYSYVSKNKIQPRTIVLLIVATLTFLITWSATSLIGIALIWIYILGENKILKWKAMNIKNYLITWAISFVFIVLLRIQNIFSFFIVDILHKDITFTGRTYVWDYAIHAIKEKPIFGYGNKVLGRLTFGDAKLRNISHSHNLILHILYSGGIVGLILFLSVMYFAVKDIWNKNHKIAKMLSFMIFTYLILSIVENYQLFGFFLILTLAGNMDSLIVKEKKKEKEVDIQ